MSEPMMPFDRDMLKFFRELERLREEIKGAEASRQLHADLNRRTAEALGKPHEGKGSSWHDIPECVAHLSAALNACDKYSRIPGSPMPADLTIAVPLQVKELREEKELLKKGLDAIIDAPISDEYKRARELLEQWWIADSTRPWLRNQTRAFLNVEK